MLRAMRRLLLLFLVVVFVAGCPTVKLNKVAVKDGSVSPTGLTLAAEVEVQETEEVDTEAGSANEGRALIAIFLPRGWAVSGARMKSPQESTTRRLIPVPQIALQFGETFPDVPGEWWAFGSNTQSVLTGTFIHGVELDLTFPKKTKAGELGLSVGILQDTLDEVPAPLIYDVVIKGKKATLKARAFEGGAMPEADPTAYNNDKASAS